MASSSSSSSSSSKYSKNSSNLQVVGRWVLGGLSVVLVLVQVSSSLGVYRSLMVAGSEDDASADFGAPSIPVRLAKWRNHQRQLSVDDELGDESEDEEDAISSGEDGSEDEEEPERRQRREPFNMKRSVARASIPETVEKLRPLRVIEAAEKKADESNNNNNKPVREDEDKQSRKTRGEITSNSNNNNKRKEKLEWKAPAADAEQPTSRRQESFAPPRKRGSPMRVSIQTVAAAPETEAKQQSPPLKEEEKSSKEEEPTETTNESDEEEQTSVSIKSDELASLVFTSSSTSSEEFPPPITSTAIRKWGCARNETPFIFVHIGKAGGGGVRARFAASALDYNRTDWHLRKKDPTYYYPMYDQHGNLHRGKLVNSESSNFLPNFPEEDRYENPFTRTFTYEGVLSCHATSPLGHAIACHQEKSICRDDQAENVHHAEEENDDRCDIVYIGHNTLGNEMHWLPTRYLLNWWNNSTWAQDDASKNPPRGTVAAKLANRYQRSHRVYDRRKKKPSSRLCLDGPLKRYYYERYYEKCILPEGELADTAAQTALNTIHHWAPIYASLPVLRVTVIREPFSWLKSKFFWQEWHLKKGGGMVLPYKSERAIQSEKMWPEEKLQRYKDAPHIQCDDMAEMTLGWGRHAAMEYMMYLCGEHCLAQWRQINESGNMQKNMKAYLQAMEEQAAYNLRNSFAVVGLLEETEDFFDMVSQRVHYMDTTLNMDVKGGSHSSGKGVEMKRCGAIFKDEKFQRKVIKQSPEIAALVRLYKIGLEVNKFQKQELEQCSATDAATATT